MEHKFKVGDRVKLLPECRVMGIAQFIGRTVTIKEFSNLNSIVFEEENTDWYVETEFVEAVPEVISGTLSVNNGGTHIPYATGTNINFNHNSGLNFNPEPIA